MWWFSWGLSSHLRAKSSICGLSWSIHQAIFSTFRVITTWMLKVERLCNYIVFIRHYSLSVKGQSPLDKWRADSGESDVYKKWAKEEIFHRSIYSSILMYFISCSFHSSNTMSWLTQNKTNLYYSLSHHQHWTSYQYLAISTKCSKIWAYGHSRKLEQMLLE